MRILIAVDLAAPAHDWLIGRADDIAARVGATLDVVYVRSPDASLATIDNQLVQLQMMLSKVDGPRRGKPRCEPGVPVEVLVALSSEYDALVVGPREPGAVERMLRGTMAARILLRAHCPVLIPRSTEWAEGSAKVLVAVDIHGRHQDKVVDYAADWTRALEGRLDAVYAVAETIPYIKEPTVRERAEKEWLARHQSEMSAVEAILKHLPDGLRGEAMLRRGQPEAALVHLSTDYHLVVLGNREREGLAGMLLGAVAQHVVRNASCDVLTLPTADLA
jgi:nucleotide-binding universal stress UspA family protein